MRDASMDTLLVTTLNHDRNLFAAARAASPQVEIFARDPKQSPATLYIQPPQKGGRRKSNVLVKKHISPKPQTLWFGPSKFKVF